MKQPRYSSRTRRTGATIVEVVVASGLSIAALFGAVLALVTGLETWARGEGQIGANSGAQMAMRTISNELRQAMQVTVNADYNDAEGFHQSITYRLPARDGQGTFLSPPQWDGVVRQIEFFRPSNGDQTDTWRRGSIRIISGIGGDRRVRVLASGVTLRDPLSRDGTELRTFVPSGDQVIRWLTVTIATAHNSARSERATTRVRETVYLRNIPSISN